MAREPRRCWSAARRWAQDRLRRGSAHTAADMNLPRCTWMGVRERPRGRWAAQIRVPGTRTSLWIGRFDQALQAALAYDTALFCLHGVHRMPSPRRFNFPAAPRPSIPEGVRAALSLSAIKDLAQSHARALAMFFVGPLPAVVRPAVPDEASATTDVSSTGSN